MAGHELKQGSSRRPLHGGNAFEPQSFSCHGNGAQATVGRVPYLNVKDRTAGLMVRAGGSAAVGIAGCPRRSL